MSQESDGTLVYETLEPTVSAEELLAIAEERKYAWGIGEPDGPDGCIGLVIPGRCAFLDQRGLVNLVESLVLVARRAWGPELFEEQEDG